MEDEMAKNLSFPSRKSWTEYGRQCKGMSVAFQKSSQSSKNIPLASERGTYQHVSTKYISYHLKIVHINKQWKFMYNLITAASAGSVNI